jgi:NADH-quinone oxidoreductase subunit N
LIVIKAAYLLEPVREYGPVRVDRWTRSLSIVLVILMIYVGIFPDKFVLLAEAAAAALR